MEAPDNSLPDEQPKDLGPLLEQAANLKNEIGTLESMVKSKSEVFNKLSATILRTLELLNLDSVRGHGFLFYKEIKASVQTPKTPEGKKELFDFLESKGIFLEMVSINSQTLNSLYKSLSQEAAEAGELEFRLPGIAEPTIYTNLKLRRG